jgi:hypothetical protein
MACQKLTTPNGFIFAFLENNNQARRQYGPIYHWPICGMQFGGFFNFFAGKIQRGRRGLLTCSPLTFGSTGGLIS